MSSAIVTGAAAGNGLAIARKLRERGHIVIGVDLAPIPSESCNHSVQGSVLDQATIDAAFAYALAASHAVYLVNNAGITSGGFPQPDDVWEKTIDVNLTAPFRWTRFYGEQVVAKRITEGAIVFVGSLATSMGFPKNAAYQASKSGVLGLTRSFAFDLGRYGIRCNCVSPGYIVTAMTQISYNTPELNAARRKHTLLDRWGQPEDVANGVAFLCDPSSAYVTGINLPVDGGWMVCGLIE
ncbi:MAG: SDR family NAD(P)-dependent oxidoreductase [Acidobacteriaceae bacterium]